MAITITKRQQFIGKDEQGNAQFELIPAVVVETDINGAEYYTVQVHGDDFEIDSRGREVEIEPEFGVVTISSVINPVLFEKIKTKFSAGKHEGMCLGGMVKSVDAGFYFKTKTGTQPGRNITVAVVGSQDKAASIAAKAIEDRRQYYVDNNLVLTDNEAIAMKAAAGQVSKEQSGF